MTDFSTELTPILFGEQLLALGVTTLAAAQAASFAAGQPYVVLRGYYAAGDGGGAVYVPATAGAGAGKFQSADGQWWKLATGPITARQLGAKGDGAADDTTPLTNFFSLVQNNVGFIEPGTYKTTSLISTALSNCKVFGVEGATTITGTFGYALLKLLDLSNVEIAGINFTTNYVQTSADLGSAVVYSFQNNVSNVHIHNCTFSAPTANTSGLSFYTNINSADNAHSIDGLWIEDNLFTSLGRIGCTLMNRYTGATRNTLARRLQFNRNKFTRTGLNGTSGICLSLDGFGQDFHVRHNICDNFLTIGIENTGWCNGEVTDNVFSNATSSAAPISSDNAGTTAQTTGVTYARNKTLDGLCGPAFVGNNTNCHFEENVFDVSSTASSNAITVRQSTKCRFIRDTYKSAGAYAFLGQHDCYANELVDCNFDTSASGANTGAVAFDATGDVGTGTTENVVTGAGTVILKGTGGFSLTQQAGAVGNICDASFYNGTTFEPVSAVVLNPSDADFAPSGIDAILVRDGYRFSGTWLAGHNITVPVQWFKKKGSIRVNNTTGQIITFVGSNGATGATLANATIANLFYDQGAGVMRVW